MVDPDDSSHYYISLKPVMYNTESTVLCDVNDSNLGEVSVESDFNYEEISSAYFDSKLEWNINYIGSEGTVVIHNHNNKTGEDLGDITVKYKVKNGKRAYLKAIKFIEGSHGPVPDPPGPSPEDIYPWESIENCQSVYAKYFVIEGIFYTEPIVQDGFVYQIGDFRTSYSSEKANYGAALVSVPWWFSDSSLEIPEYIFTFGEGNGWVPVVAIGDLTFGNVVQNPCAINSVTIPKTVKTIYPNVFSNCEMLERVELKCEGAVMFESDGDFGTSGKYFPHPFYSYISDQYEPPFPVNEEIIDSPGVFRYDFETRVVEDNGGVYMEVAPIHGIVTDIYGMPVQGAKVIFNDRCST